ncbi:hypothetical protein [Myxosarcina sp. GI1(2024)]
MIIIFMISEMRYFLDYRLTLAVVRVRGYDENRYHDRQQLSNN